MSNRDSKGDINNTADCSIDESPLARDLASSESKIDLGLGSLLNLGQSLEIEPSKQADSVEIAPIVASEQAVNKVATALSEFEQLAQLGKWKELLQSTESILEDQSLRLGDSNRWIEAQAWWIIAQLEIKSLPAAVLLAPLEAMLESLIGAHSSNHSKADKNQASDKELINNADLVKRASAQLISRFFSQSDMTAGMQLVSRTRVLGEDLSALTDVIKHYLPQLESLSGSEQRLYSIMCKELSLERPALNKNNEKILSDLSLEAQSKANKVLKTKTEAAPRNHFILLTSIIFIVLFGSSIVGLIYFLKPKAEVEFPHDVNKIDFPKAAFEAPKPEPVTKVSQLDEVLYGMENKENKGQTLSPSNSPNTSVTPIAVSPKQPAAQKPKVVLDTKGPIESGKLRDLREQQARNSENQNAKQAPEIVVPGPAQAPSFETFPSPRVYTVVRATNLMLRPSLNSDAVAGLSKGDRVKVVGAAGYWLRVMSRQGRIAYVIREDTRAD